MMVFGIRRIMVFERHVCCTLMSDLECMEKAYVIVFFMTVGLLEDNFMTMSPCD